MTSRKFYFQNILILAPDSEKRFEIAAIDKVQLDLKNNDRDIGNCRLICLLSNYCILCLVLNGNLASLLMQWLTVSCMASHIQEHTVSCMASLLS